MSKIGDKKSWIKLIVFAVAIAVLTGVIMLLPFMDENAFRDIGVGYAMWIIFAIMIVGKCDSAVEAGLKCIVFFLISQPLIYLVQQPFVDINLIQTYYKPWFIQTLFTLPGGMIAYQIKREDLLGSAILGIADGGLACNAAVSVINCLVKGMGISHLLYAVVCLGSAIYFLCKYCPGVKKKIPCLILIIAGIAIGAYFALGMDEVTDDYQLPEGTWTLEDSNSRNIIETLEDGSVLHFTITADEGSEYLELKNENGDILKLNITFANGVFTYEPEYTKR